jgi:hypothetical protein
MKHWCASIVTLATLFACDSGRVGTGGALIAQKQPVVRDEHTATVRDKDTVQLGHGTPVAAAAATPPPTEPTAPPTGHTAAAGDIDWSHSLHWLDYSSGLSAAKKSGKPIMLLVYADWCPKCRALAPVFDSPAVRELANKLVAVRQDQDDPAPWLNQLADGRGNYVPRVIFLNAQGTPLNVTSGHPRYPYFYAAENPEALLSSIKQVLRI